MALAPDVHIYYHYQALPRAVGRVINAPKIVNGDPFSDLSGQNEQAVFIAEALFNQGNFDALMALYPPQLDEDESAMAGRPYAFHLSRREKITSYKILTGKVFLGGDFIQDPAWKDEKQFLVYLECKKKQGGKAPFKTRDGMKTMFDFGKRDILYRREKNGLYKPDSLFKKNEVDFVPRPNLLVSSDPSLNPN